MYLACCVTFHFTEASYSTSSPFHTTLGINSKPRTIRVPAKGVDLFHITQHYLRAKEEFLWSLPACHGYNTTQNCRKVIFIIKVFLANRLNR